MVRQGPSPDGCVPAGATQTKRVTLSGLVLDPLAEHDAAVDRRRGGRAERRPGLVGLGDLRTASAVLGAARDLGLRQVLADEAGALRARLRVGEHHLDLARASSSRAGDQAVADRVVVLADDRRRRRRRRRGCRASRGPSPRSSSRTGPAPGRPRPRRRPRSRRRRSPRGSGSTSASAGRGAQGVLAEGPGWAEVGDAHGGEARPPAAGRRARRLVEGDRVGGRVVVRDCSPGTGRTLTSSVSASPGAGVGLEGRSWRLGRPGVELASIASPSSAAAAVSLKSTVTSVSSVSPLFWTWTSSSWGAAAADRSSALPAVERDVPLIVVPSSASAVDSLRRRAGVAAQRAVELSWSSLQVVEPVGRRAREGTARRGPCRSTPSSCEAPSDLRLARARRARRWPGTRACRRRSASIASVRPSLPSAVGISSAIPASASRRSS